MAGDIAEMVLIRPETTLEELNASSVMDQGVLVELRKQRASRLGSEVLKNPKRCSARGPLSEGVYGAHQRRLDP
ncbi:hypothetical protein PC128_g21640 [Phytophthora cactorum]|nr:hypothetical protein PC128_g21640 [Phytophthora cactorum]